MEKIRFVEEDGTETEFFVEEQTRMNGYNYLLVTDSQDDEAQAYILKDLSKDTDPQASYVMVEDDREFEVISRLFADMLEDVDLETES
ncbi:MAG TPA: DUF1292 domain-containing protein [Candidatus Ruminococcus avistercoris]|nr:DUF1292 domain-containing protein [Candidatus Ruminococcus avistercoris]